MHKRTRYNMPGIVGLPGADAPEVRGGRGRLSARSEARRSRMQARMRPRTRVERWREAREMGARPRTLVCLCCAYTSPYHIGVAPYREFCPKCGASMTMARP
jgi:hypothetical protein